MLAAKNLCKKVKTLDGDLTILDDVNFQLAEGESLAIVGASGSGKTTLLGLLAGLDRATSGDVILKDEAVFSLSEDALAALRMQHLGFVFQNFQLIDGLTAIENVSLPLELRADQKAQQKAQQMLAEVGLSDRLHHHTNQLSGGEQQRVAIARAFVTKPDLLLADEPTGNLDTHTGEKVIELMFSLNKSYQTTLVLVTHDREVNARCHYQLVLSAGKVVEFSAHHTDSVNNKGLPPAKAVHSHSDEQEA